MKARSIIGAVILIVGFFLAVCTADESKHELVLRLVGVALSIAGVVVGRFYKDPTQQEQ